jgi:outer membrane protein OmpA-like peptidoglycan-associated protein
MRARRNREVNIFSASVVDLFASGLGVFLIVAIIALVNQKKETSKARQGGLTGTVVETETEEKKIGQKKNYAPADEAFISDLEQKVEKLEIRINEKTKENFDLKKQLLEVSIEKDKSSSGEDDKKFMIAAIKQEYAKQAQNLEIKNADLQKEIKEQKQKIADLKKALDSQSKYAKEGKKGVGTNFNEFEIGSRIKLENVHFYPGTENAIEPYASREVSDLADFLKENSMVTIEVSGHIFETKEAIDAGKAEDEYNLSGRRAEYVCNKLVEFGVKRKRMRCLGYGASRPLYLTDDQYSEQAQLNRRVEVEILTK